MVPEMFGFLFPILWFAVLVFLVTLAYRLVKAVERIADILEERETIK